MPGTAELVRVARQALSRGDHAKALALLQEAVGVAPGSADARMLLGVCLWTAGRQEEGLQQLRRAVELDPSGALGHYNLGAMLNLSGRSAEAAEQFQAALALDPDYQRATEALGALRAAAQLVPPTEEVAPEPAEAGSGSDQPSEATAPEIAEAAPRLEQPSQLALPDITEAALATERPKSQWYDSLVAALETFDLPPPATAGSEEPAVEPMPEDQQ